MIKVYASGCSCLWLFAHFCRTKIAPDCEHVAPEVSRLYLKVFLLLSSVQRKLRQSWSCSWMPLCLNIASMSTVTATENCLKRRRRPCMLQSGSGPVSNAPLSEMPWYFKAAFVTLADFVWLQFVDHWGMRKVPKRVCATRVCICDEVFIQIYFDSLLLAFIEMFVPLQSLLQSVPMNFGNEVVIGECDVFLPWKSHLVSVTNEFHCVIADQKSIFVILRLSFGRTLVEVQSFNCPRKFERAKNEDVFWNGLNSDHD